MRLNEPLGLNSVIPRRTSTEGLFLSHDKQQLFGAPRGPSKAFLRNPLLSCRLEVQADVQKEIFPKDSVSLGAISDNASTRAMAGSIISSYNPQDR